MTVLARERAYQSNTISRRPAGQGRTGQDRIGYTGEEEGEDVSVGNTARGDISTGWSPAHIAIDSIHIISKN
jgi:hypothetical protein